MRFVRTAVAVLVLAVSQVALAAPCGGFVDVDDSNPGDAPFCASVEWVKNRGITLGLTSTLYDPNSPVTRLQMAVFLYRLGFQNTFLQGGNAFGATAVLGTTDARPIEIIVDGQRAMRIAHVAIPTTATPGINITGGHPDNVVLRNCTGIGCAVGDAVRGGTIAGGGGPNSFVNRVTDSWGVVGGGVGNTAGNDNAIHNDALFAVVGGGKDNTASGSAATVPGGAGNHAAGAYSFAAGQHATANAPGCFVWSDGNGSVQCNDPDLYIARASGGFRLHTNGALSTGCTITAGGGSWNCSSSREVKEDFGEVDVRVILDRVAALPISTWRYRDEASGARHLGPTSEDFREAFGLGHSSTEIGLLDGQGVALGAIQGLNAKVEQRLATKDAEIAALRGELAAIRSLLATIAARSTQTAEIAP